MTADESNMPYKDDLYSCNIKDCETQRSNNIPVEPINLLDQISNLIIERADSPDL